MQTTQSALPPAIVLDLDGVIIRNPDQALTGPPLTDGNFWHHHWTNPDMSAINQEMVDMSGIFHIAGMSVFILTARPDIYWTQTVRLLRDANVEYDGLIMLPGDTVPHSSAAWKQQQVATLMKKYNVLFMVEDYRANAEAVRALVPVLLYERKKISDHLRATYVCCGGLSRCFCPPNS